MIRILAFVFVATTMGAAHAQATMDQGTSQVFRPADENDLGQFLWINRPVVVFSDSPADPRFSEQMEYLEKGVDMLMERDVVVLTDTDPAAKSPLRQKLRPRGFMLVLIGKDGEVKLRKPLPWTVREITRSIDKTPEREREINRRRGF
ncbi:DUF4174 domain-containing protein [Sedimentitalea sp. JM2-8]|uniref:DUF4174 domain-containing protein n=1 Tax=Sedimentitalea xiamensis TaxID=3050037 RepID=A0ABT7FJI2_9RHOB|nr:DUF4174 domain-containing protein [Sedimentitalea xiamensis]MDK3074939.1 DUF4174 domain-containing protein [Sedimentitalea xiamensis]